ncbi:GNAT family N-acetyltransferase [Halorussus amylolyticus]|uniref:GNAT family N-acetyltransferase n=1 Tax=Halorussus amylolyticus TaxID=1126242 RepID=UPI00192F8D45|nr:GNAT family N-acetyltransferase [Halorussus amylolyticus]
MAGEMHTESRLAVELCEDPDAWDSFVERNDGPAYATWGWGDAVESYGHDRWYLVARDSGTDIVGALPLFHVESRLFGSKLLSPAFAERGSVVVGDNRRDEAANLLLDRTKALADRLDVDFVSLRGSQVEGTDDYVEKNRYVTFRVSTDRDAESVWADVKDSRQRQIEQADDDESLTFGVGDSLADLREYYDLYLESMRGHGTPAHSFEFFRILWNRLHDAGNLRLSTIHRNGELINGMIDLSLGSTVYQWGVVSDYDHRDLNGGSLLLWKSLEWAAESGFDAYEFGRTREGSGVYMFKKSFGGQKTWYDDLHYFPGGSANLPDPDDDKYDRAKEVWRRLPIPVTRVVGPQVRKRIGL